MRIAIATPLYPPEIGGPATYVSLLEQELPKQGIEVKVVKFNEVRHLPKLIRHFVYYRRVLKAARTADVILALDPVSVGLPAMWAAKKLHKKFIIRIPGDYAWEQGIQRFGVTDILDDFVRRSDYSLPIRILKKIQSRVTRNAIRVIVPSEYLKSIVEAWGVSQEKISVIYNSIEIPTEIRSPEKVGGEFLIVSAGRRVPWKGFEAIERVARRYPHWRVCIASGLSREETLGLIKAANVFVLNSLYEGLSHVLIEAMTLGTPVVVTSSGGNKELVVHNETGLLIPPGDDTALERALEVVERDPLSAARRARAGQKRMDDFSISHMIDSTVTLLTSL